MTQVMHQPSQHDTLVLTQCKKWFAVLAQTRDGLVSFLKRAHHFIAQVSGADAVLEPAVCRAREYRVVGSELVEVFEALH